MRNVRDGHGGSSRRRLVVVVRGRRAGGTRADIVDRLAEAMRQVFASAQAGLKNLGNEPFPLTPQGAAFNKAEVDKLAAVARSANIQVD
jgi:hypothetical protein